MTGAASVAPPRREFQSDHAPKRVSECEEEWANELFHSTRSTREIVVTPDGWIGEIERSQSQDDDADLSE